MSVLSADNRTNRIKQLQSDTFDLLVIGGGITGAGIALDAASRGLKVALIEKKDFASGTSSRSTKLIHGGLRYLKQLDISLVRETGKERAVVHKLAPHLVVPEKMLLPLIEGGTYGRRATSFGLKVYDWLAGVTGDDKRVMLNKEDTLTKEPLLNAKTLKGGGYYAEYRTDDARLTIANIKTASKYGALPCNYVEAKEFMLEDGKVRGVIAHDLIGNQQFVIDAKAVVSATGPWVDTLRKINKSLKGKRLHLSKGVHLVVPYERFPVKQSVYFDVPDGRMIFAIPRGKITYIGTTDTDYHGSIDKVKTELEDVVYIITAVNDTFPSIQLEIEDVQSSWAGLRPLIHEDGKSASQLSRKDEIFEAPNDLVSIAGGKLTGYRKMAERIVNLVLKKFFDKKVKNKTDKITLIGGEFANYEEVLAYQKTIAEKIKDYYLKDVHAEYLVHLYGKQAELVLPQFEKYCYYHTVENALVLAELDFCFENEMVQTPNDFFVRRTGRIYFDINSVQKTKKTVLDIFAKKFDWDLATQNKYAALLEEALQEASVFAHKDLPEKQVQVS